MRKIEEKYGKEGRRWERERSKKEKDREKGRGREERGAV